MKISCRCPFLVHVFATSTNHMSWHLHLNLHHLPTTMKSLARSVKKLHRHWNLLQNWYSTHSSQLSWFIHKWDGLQLSQLKIKMHELSNSLLILHGNESSDNSIRSLCTQSAINSFTLFQNLFNLSKSRLQDAAVFYRQHAKLLYILLRVFCVLIAKGFCSVHILFAVGPHIGIDLRISCPIQQPHSDGRMHSIFIGIMLRTLMWYGTE